MLLEYLGIDRSIRLLRCQLADAGLAQWTSELPESGLKCRDSRFSTIQAGELAVSCQLSLQLTVQYSLYISFKRIMTKLAHQST